MKHLLILLISILLLSSPLFGQETSVSYHWENGTKYEGKWKDGKFHGQGTFTFSDGNKGVGEFRDNKPWNITTYKIHVNIIGKYVNGKEIKQ